MMERTRFNIPELSRDELAELIAYHNRRYWELNEPEIPDDVYDALVEALRRRDPRHSLLERIGRVTVDSADKVRHPEPMLSLDKAYSLTAVLEWARKFARTPDEPLLVEPKYDGISARYDGKVLSTRGDGEEGENITAKLPLLELEAPGYTGPLNRPARGEIVIRDDDFRSIYSRIRKKDGGLYKNSRNAVAGIMGLKEIDDLLRQGAKLTLADYNLVSIRVPLSELEARWPELLAQLGRLPYPQDGVVLKFADAEFRNSLGNTVHHPRGEIAFKFSNIRRSSRLLGVEWSFGKDSLTPVALLDPVEISGTTIRRATLHNAQNIIDMGIMIGDGVEVERAGDVIPYIVSSTPGRERRPALIEDCPSCGTRLVRRGPELACPNPECFETALQRLLAAVRSLGIEHLGEPTLRQLMTKCAVRHLGDLFELRAADVLKLDKFAKKSTENLLAEIRGARVVRDYQLLAALNIPHIGVNVARSLLTGRTLDELRGMDETALAAVSGIGPERAAALVRAFAEQRSYLDELLSAVTLVHETETAELPTVCFTGKMPNKRSWYEKLAVAHGYRVTDTVRRDLTLLVAADPAASGGKLAEAHRHGVKVVALADFLAGLGGAGAGDVKAEAAEQPDLFSLPSAGERPPEPDDLFPGF